MNKLSINHVALTLFLEGEDEGQCRELMWEMMFSIKVMTVKCDLKQSKINDDVLLV